MAEESTPTCPASNQPSIGETLPPQPSTRTCPASNQPSIGETLPPQPSTRTNQRGPKEIVNADSQTPTWSEITNKLISQQVIYVSETGGQGQHRHGNASSCAHTNGLRWEDILDMIVRNHNQLCGHTGVVYSHDTIQANVVLEVDDASESPGISSTSSDLPSALTLNVDDSHGGILTLAAIAASFDDIKAGMETDEMGTLSKPGTGVISLQNQTGERCPVVNKVVNVKASASSTQNSGSCGSKEAPSFDDASDANAILQGLSSGQYGRKDKSKETESRITVTSASRVQQSVIGSGGIHKDDKIETKKNLTDDEQGLVHHDKGIKKGPMATHKPLKVLPAQCSVCLARFRSRCALKKHSKVHEEGHCKHPCQHCDKICRTKYHLELHTKGSHSGTKKTRAKRSVTVPKRYRVDNDEEEKSSKGESVSESPADNIKSSEDAAGKKRETRKKQTKQKKSTVCSVCNKSFKFPRSLKRHEWVHLKKREFPCQHCDKVCKSAHYLKLHMLVHAEQKQHKCRHCDASFGIRVHLRQHKAKEHSILEKHLCNICGATYLSKYSLDDHMIVHTNKKPLLCQICGNTFQRPMALRRHMSYHSSRTNPSAHLCDQCSKAFPTIAMLNLHVRKHHLNERKHKCSVCGIGFFTRNERFKHERVHVEKTMLNHMCSYCGKHFAHEQSLAAHKRRHTGNRPYSCQLCNRSYITKTQVKVHHKKAHTAKSLEEKNVRPFQCTICGSRFSSRATYLSHEKRHAGIKDQKCQFCDASFVTSSELLRHVKRHVGGKPFKCGLCDLRFAKKRELTEHEGSHDYAAEGPSVALTADDKGPSDALSVDKHELMQHPGSQNVAEVPPGFVGDDIVLVDVPIGQLQVTLYQ